VRGNADLLNEQRRQEFFERWSRVRAEGVFKFGLKVTTSFSLSVFVLMSVMDFLQDGIPNGKRLLVRWITCVMSGVILSAISWWTNEGRYKNILIDNRIRPRDTLIGYEGTRSPAERGRSATQ
jgi:hypothetical protein